MRYELEPVQRICPACQNTDAERLYTVTSEQAAQHFARREVDPNLFEKFKAEIQHLWGKPTCDVVRCRTCSLGFASPYVAGREQFYGLLLSSPDFTQDRFEFRMTRDALGSLLGMADDQAASVDEDSRPALLEVGAGDGAFVRQVIGSLLPANRVICTEFSAPGADRIRSSGAACEMVDVRELDKTRYRSAFTAICMFQIMEHLDQLDELSETFTTLSRPRGRLFLSVPNARGIEFNELNGGLLDMPPNHLGRWTRAAFDAISRRHGWEVVEDAMESTSPFQLVHQLGGSRYVQARQTSGSITDRMTRFQNRTLRRLASIPTFAAWLALSIPAAFRTDHSRLGGAYWVHFRKN